MGEVLSALSVWLEFLFCPELSEDLVFGVAASPFVALSVPEPETAASLVCPEAFGSDAESAGFGRTVSLVAVLVVTCEDFVPSAVFCSWAHPFR